jgi:hypothetical protein
MLVSSPNGRRRENLEGIIPRFDTPRPRPYPGEMALDWTTSSTSERAVTIALAAGLVAYALIALSAHRFVSAMVAPGVAALLVWRHPRARFSAYVFFSALAVRGLVAGAWALALFAGAAIVVMQTPPAVRAWPRVVAGRTRPAGDASST